MIAKMEIQGAKELERNLATLGQRVHKKVVRKAVREGQRPLLAAAKANARSMVGGDMGSKIASNLEIRAPKKQERGSYVLLVRMKAGIQEFVYYRKGAHSLLKPGGGPGKEIGRTYIPAAIEYGHMNGPTYVPPIPFAQNAADATRSETIRRFTNEMRIGTLREAIKGRYAG